MTLRTELDFYVKEENQSDEMYSSEIVKLSTPSETESQTVKVELHVDPPTNLCPDCESKNSQIAVLNLEREKLIFEKSFNRTHLEAEVRATELQNRLLRQELQQLQSKCQFMETQHDVDANRNVALNDQVEKLKTELAEIKLKIKDEFEVEKLLKHRKYKNRMKFLIRWKGYGAANDSWVWRENLNCPAILDNYLKSKKLC